jgi:ribonuclease HI
LYVYCSPPHLTCIYHSLHFSLPASQSWINRWKANGWRSATGKDVKHRDLIAYLDALLELRVRRGQKAVLEHVKGHRGVRGNEMADMLAAVGAGKPVMEERDWEEARRAVVKRLGEEGEWSGTGSSKNV